MQRVRIAVVAMALLALAVGCLAAVTEVGAEIVFALLPLRDRDQIKWDLVISGFAAFPLAEGWNVRATAGVNLGQMGLAGSIALLRPVAADASVEGVLDLAWTHRTLTGIVHLGAEGSIDLAAGGRLGWATLPFRWLLTHAYGIPAGAFLFAPDVYAEYAPSSHSSFLFTQGLGFGIHPTPPSAGQAAISVGSALGLTVQIVTRVGFTP